MEIDQSEMDELTPAQLGELVAKIQNFFSERAPRSAFSLLIHDRQGLRTLGNMPPDVTYEAAVMIVERMRPGGEGADACFEIEIGQPALPRAKH